MGQWSDVNALQSKIRKAENELTELCNDCANAKAKMAAKKEELKALYDEQDREVKGILGPRALYDLEKKMEGKI